MWVFRMGRITTKGAGTQGLKSLYTGRTVASVPEGREAGARGGATPCPPVGVNRCPCGEQTDLQSLQVTSHVSLRGQTDVTRARPSSLGLWERKLANEL